MGCNGVQGRHQPNAKATTPCSPLLKAMPRNSFLPCPTVSITTCGEQFEWGWAGVVISRSTLGLPCLMLCRELGAPCTGGKGRGKYTWHHAAA